MSTIIDRSLEALSDARAEIAQSRKRVVLVLGLFLLVHILTVYPFLKIKNSSERLQDEIAEQEEKLASLEAAAKKVTDTGNMVILELDKSLKEGTDKMIGEFGQFRTYMDQALKGELEFESASPDSRMLEQTQHSATPQSNLRRLDSNSVRTRQFPQNRLDQVQRTAPDLSVGQADPDDETYRPVWLGPTIVEIAEDINSGSETAQGKLTSFAKSNIVNPVYEDIGGIWENNLKPDYLEALKEAEASTENLINSNLKNSDALQASLDSIVSARTTLETFSISPDNTIDQSLETEWWHTVSGKMDYAAALNNQVESKLMSVRTAAEDPIKELKAILEKQKTIRDSLAEEQAEVQELFETQLGQITNFMGVGGIVPIDFLVFIGLYPLILGLIPGFFMFRASWATQESIRKTNYLLTLHGDHQEEARWHATGLLNSGSLKRFVRAVFIITTLWILGSAIHLYNSPIKPIVAIWLTAGLGIFTIVYPCYSLLISIRQLQDLESSGNS